MEKKHIVKQAGSQYKLAKSLKVYTSTVTRWGRWIPKKYHERIRAQQWYRP